jgi:hypothetical protein
MSSTQARQALPDRRTAYLQEHPNAAPLGFTATVTADVLRTCALVGYTGYRVAAIAAAGAADAAGITDPTPYVVDVTTDVDGALTLTGHTDAGTIPLDGVTRHTLPDLLHMLNAAPTTLGGEN